MLLAGLGAGLVGSLIGLAGAWAIDRHRANVQMRGAARALFFELVRNGVVLQMMADEDVPAGAISDVVWRETMVSVAMLLRPEVFATVSKAYSLLEYDQRRIQRVREGHKVDDADRGSWRQAGRAYGEAADAIRPWAWPARAAASLGPVKDL